MLRRTSAARARQLRPGRDAARRCDRSARRSAAGGSVAGAQERSAPRNPCSGRRLASAAHARRGAAASASSRWGCGRRSAAVAAGGAAARCMLRHARRATGDAAPRRRRLGCGVLRLTRPTAQPWVKAAPTSAGGQRRRSRAPRQRIARQAQSSTRRQRRAFLFRLAGARTGVCRAQQRAQGDACAVPRRRASRTAQDGRWGSAHRRDRTR